MIKKRIKVSKKRVLKKAVLIYDQSKNIIQKDGIKER